jgi:hypothetical protein
MRGERRDIIRFRGDRFFRIAVAHADGARDEYVVISSTHAGATSLAREAARRSGSTVLAIQPVPELNKKADHGLRRSRVAAAIAFAFAVAAVVVTAIALAPPAG